MPLEHFHPTIRWWFAGRFGEPTEPQREGWERIRSGRHMLIFRADLSRYNGFLGESRHLAIH
jgi:Lhr-like helicase